MEKTIQFGKIDLNGCGRKVNLAEVEIRWDGKRLSICGNVWNAMHTDCLTCGQCLDTMKEFLFTNKKLRKVYSLWKEWHLNDMNSGTKKQENAINEWLKCEKCHYDYDKVCDYLKSIGLYEDVLGEGETCEGYENGKPYKYGHGWITREIPAEIVKEIEELMA